MNEQIKASEVRLVGEDGEALGIMSLQEAKRLADEKDLDLVEISPNASPKVCKIMNYGKYKYEQVKREKEAKQKQKVAEIKTIRIGLNISEHDIDYRCKQALEFLKDGNKVKLNMMLRGRQNAYADNGIETLNGVAQKIGDDAVVEKAPFKEGRYINMILAPKK
ncbi:MAG: translation initiation factor IF-3 [Clostridiales bacterium]|nr:translation initiation factor IF-3 [Candidatus Apopatousia equi]